MRHLLVPLLAGLAVCCHADTLIYGGNIYTVTEEMPRAEAVYVRDGKISFVGGLKAARRFVGDDTLEIDLAGRTMTPGIIEGHGHIMSLGFSKLNLDLSRAASFDDVVQQVAEAAAIATPGDWILGRGWHQSKWSPQPARMIKGFQTHEKLSAVSPNNPVYLVHASGHAAMANARAMEIAGVTAETEFSGDGEIIKDEQSQPTGIFNEVAQGVIRRHVPKPSAAQASRALELALTEMARSGITSFQDAGSSEPEIALYKKFLAEGKLTSRFWIMLAGRDSAMLDRWFTQGPEIGLGDERLTIRAVKLVADGALGSRGAWLLEAYSDRADHVGLPTMSPAYMLDVTRRAFASDFQVGIHAIGDRANREVLDIYDSVFEGKDQGVRFRIEHAQHLDASDIPRFAALGVIPSMQGIHMSSDRPWAINRLGSSRIVEGAYVWRKLIDSGAVLVNGTDVPVEPIDPIASFYSLVTRQTLAGEPPGGFEPAQRLSRGEALRAYTLHAAYGAFEEHIKGSIVAGKLADFTIFDRDIMRVSPEELLQTRVTQTIVAGKTIYRL